MRPRPIRGLSPFRGASTSEAALRLLHCHIAMKKILLAARHDNHAFPNSFATIGSLWIMPCEDQCISAFAVAAHRSCSRGSGSFCSRRRASKPDWVLSAHEYQRHTGLGREKSRCCGSLPRPTHLMEKICSPQPTQGLRRPLARCSNRFCRCVPKKD